VIQKVVSPVVVGRSEELDRLEDALLAANRCESRFVVLAGEAGIGKTRLAGELERRAHKLGTTVLWGSCSEAELALPYLPILEALGNYLAVQDAKTLADRLGPAARELAQLFPQLGAPTTSPTADPTQTKLRLFESMISLLTIPADDTGVLLVIEDIHWADASTRELLDYLTRRLRSLRIMVLATYRNDELHRRHPLLPTIQRWRRAGFAEIVELQEISQAEVGDIISAILDTDDLSGDFMRFMHERTEGNPFVLEEMLKDSLDRGDIYRADGGWEQRSVEELRLPDSVRDTILLRVQRLSDEEVAVLQVASVLGRSFDYSMLATVADLDEAAIHKHLETSIQEQLVEEDPSAPARYRFRHALTQEAIYNDMVMPRRNRIHSRAADFLTGRPGARVVEIAHHLLGARRFEDAVPVCIEGAEQAERAYAYQEAFKLYDHALEHVTDPRLEAELPCRMGKALWFDSQPRQADAYLTDGVAGLEALGEETLAAHYLIVRGRCRWELSRPDLAAHDYERARAILEPQGPSTDLAFAYLRISGLHAFELEADRAHAAAQKAVDLAGRVGDTQTHAWALGFVGLAEVDLGRIDEGLANLDLAYREAADAGHMYVANNTAYNDLWMRVHLMLPVDDRLARIERLREKTAGTFFLGSVHMSRSYVYNARGEVALALDSSKRGLELFESLEATKYAWRCNLLLAEALAENNAVDDAFRHLPDISERSEIQDIVYDSPARIRCLMARGDTALLAEMARSILDAADSLELFQVTLSLGVEAFLGAGLIYEADALLDKQQSLHRGIGEPFVDRSRALVALARGRLDEVVEPARRAIAAFAQTGYKPHELRTRLALARALAGRGDAAEASNEISAVAGEARARGAKLVEREASQAAAELDLAVELEPEEAPTDHAVDVGAGERLVTVMFADVRGYTAMSGERSPRDMAERIASLQRWAAREIDRHGGIVDKFAGDAVMATFNVSGARIDHAEHAMEAAIALQDKGALMDLGLGVGLAAGPAIVGTFVSGSNMSVIGETTNLAARLQSQAQSGEVLLSADAFKRLAGWLDARGFPTSKEELSLKGFDAPVPAYRVTRPDYAGGAPPRTAGVGR
jgi:class 3 adenylate cyclase